eukprot:10563859-Ditylum_brightwellii.AAC.1
MQFTIEGLTPDTTHRWNVVAFDAEENFSPFSDEISVKPIALGVIDQATETPSSPTNGGSTTAGTIEDRGNASIGIPEHASARKVQPTMVTLTWKAPNGDSAVAGYNIYYD